MPLNPSRLVLARKRRGLSQTSLARLCNLSLRSLGRYEAGTSEPSEDTIAILAQKLEFPIAFFSGPDLEEIGQDSASFRSLSRMTASQRDSALAAGSLAIALCTWIEEKFELPEPAVPSLRGFDPETAAQVLREEWGIGQRPIDNVVHLLEAHGVRVFSLPTDSASVDAFSGWRRETPFVFLNPMKSAERGRMDASHEIGHLTLHHHGIPRNRQAELEADAFAGAFLMPEGDVLAHAPRGITINTILKMKFRWGVSAIAMVHRLKTLRVITEWQYRTYCIELSKQGYRHEERDGITRDNSQIFAKVFEALRSDGISRGTIARELMITSAELDLLLRGLTITSVPTAKSKS